MIGRVSNRGERFHPPEGGDSERGLRCSWRQPSASSLEVPLSPTGAVVTKMKRNPGHTSVGVGTLAAVLIAVQAHDWLAAGVGFAGLMPPVAIFIWHVGIRNFWALVINGDGHAAVDIQQA